MKLRLHGGSLRLRLGPGEVASLLKGQSVAESLHFGPKSWQQFHYTLQVEEGAAQPRAEFTDNTISVAVPAAMLRRWGESDAVSIESTQAAGRGQTLQILIEKDFACLHGQSVTEDVFPNPLEAS